MVEIFDNIRKIYKFSSPCPELSDYIEFFSESSLEETNKYIANKCFTIKMFPSWTPTIWINLGEPYRLCLGEDRYFIRREDDILILRNSAAERHNLPTDHIFTVKFFPGGLEAILDINQSKFINKIVDLNAVIPVQLIQRIKELNSFEERMELLQDFFLVNYKKKKTQDYYLKFVRDTTEAYGAANMKFNNSEIAEKMFTTSKTINRYFNNIIGTTPKNYFSILKARIGLTAYVANKQLFDPSDYGYYDMSHFYKTVVKFTGQKLVDNRL